MGQFSLRYVRKHLKDVLRQLMDRELDVFLSLFSWQAMKNRVTYSSAYFKAKLVSRYEDTTERGR